MLIYTHNGHNTPILVIGRNALIRVVGHNALAGVLNRSPKYTCESGCRRCDTAQNRQNQKRSPEMN